MICLIVSAKCTKDLKFIVYRLLKDIINMYDNVKSKELLLKAPNSQTLFIFVSRDTVNLGEIIHYSIS